MRRIVEICRNYENVDAKDSTELVVGGICRRGGSIPTRYGTLVVLAVVSCLEVVECVGRDDRVFSSRYCRKGVDLMKMGG